MSLDLTNDRFLKIDAAKFTEKLLGVFHHEPTAAPHRHVWSDQIAFPRLPQAFFTPIASSGHQSIEAIGRKLEHEDTDHVGPIENGAHGKSHLSAQTWAVGFKVGDFVDVPVLGELQFLGFAGKLGVAVRPVFEACCKLGGFGVAVDNIHCFGIDEHNIVESKYLHRTRKTRVHLLMDQSVVARVALGQQQLPLGFILIGILHQVVVLQIATFRAHRQVLFDERLGIDDLPHLGKERACIELLDFFGLRLADLNRLQFVVGSRKSFHALNGYAAIGYRDNLISERFEPDTQSRGLGNLDPFELILDAFFNRGFPRCVADPSHRAQGAKSHEQQKKDHFGLDTQPVESKHRGSRSSVKKGA